MRRISHRFRFQLLHAWLVDHYQPCKAADVGGGKGLLAYLLNQSGWKTTVIDPVPQMLPRTFKDLYKTRTTLTLEQRKALPRIDKPFDNNMAGGFDLLVGLHAHGSNLKIIDSCSEYGKKFVLLPCCVIDEPINIMPGINWLDSLVKYARDKGFEVGKDKLNFAGQDTIIFSI
ncbi:MAG: hypothetical protein AAB697_00100 [Patescibacteria group bacterium]